MNPLVNPLAFTKCAGRLFMALAALTSILLIVGCGNSSSSSPANQEGFSASNLNGTYVFTSQGTDSDGDPLFLAGSFVANGSTISSGTMDVLDPNVGSTFGASITSASYTVGTDGRGTLSLNSSAGQFGLAFVLTTTSGGVSSQGLLTEFDSNGSGSGTLTLQTAITSFTAGNYAFSLAGLDVNGDPLALAGAFALSSSGGVTGVEDFNHNATAVSFESLIAGGVATLGTGTAPGSIVIGTSSFPGLTFDLYPISATQFALVESDNLNFLAGNVFSQAGASIASGSVAFTMAGGLENFSPVADGGTVTVPANGVGDYSAGLEDLNSNGTYTPQTSFTGTGVSAGGSAYGRVVVSLTGFSPASDWVLYPSSGGILMLEADTGGVTAGAAFAQASGSTMAAAGYGFNLLADNTSGPYMEADNAQFTTTSSGFSGLIDINDSGTTSPGQTFVSTSFTAPNGVGEGSAVTTEAGNPYISFNFYMVDSSTFLVLETDGNQIGTGSFALQDTPSSSSSVAHRAIAMARPMAHHAIKRRK